MTYIEGTIETNSNDDSSNNINSIINNDPSPSHIFTNVNFRIFTQIAINNQQNDNYPEHFFDNTSSTTTNTRLIMTSTA